MVPIFDQHGEMSLGGWSEMNRATRHCGLRENVEMHHGMKECCWNSVNFKIWKYRNWRIWRVSLFAAVNRKGSWRKCWKPKQLLRFYWRYQLWKHYGSSSLLGTEEDDLIPKSKWRGGWPYCCVVMRKKDKTCFHEGQQECSSSSHCCSYTKYVVALAKHQPGSTKCLAFHISYYDDFVGTDQLTGGYYSPDAGNDTLIAGS